MLDNSKFKIFQEFCNSKVNLATEFFTDNILSSLGMEIEFFVKYQNIRKYVLDFSVIVDSLIKFSIIYLQNDNYSYEKVRLYF